VDDTELPVFVFEILDTEDVVPFDRTEEELVTDMGFETDAEAEAEVVVFWKSELVLERETVDEVTFLVDVEFLKIPLLFPVPFGTVPVPVPV